MLGVLEDDINFSITEVNGKGVALNMKDKSSAINYMLADLSVIPKAPDLKKLPDFNVNVKLDSNFISKFIRATSALGDEKNFTFVSKDGKSEIILGFSSINTNRINIEVDATTTGDVAPISFSAQYLKEILAANRDATEATLDISSQGLSHVEFEVGDYTSSYFLVEVAI
jgi:DNA polymerase III sliding clamp (beta) subunit (PCNA family)